MTKPRLCFIGSNGPFSLAALQALLARPITVSQIILAGYPPAAQPTRHLPIAAPQATENTPVTIPALAEHHHIPIHYTHRDLQTLSSQHSTQPGDNIQDFVRWQNFAHHTPPDVLLVACFPYRLSAALRDWPTRLAINLHPSLLPAYRGPDPVFWQLQRDEKQTGISLHVVSEALDSGPILLQKSIAYPQGATRRALDKLLAREGSEALCDWLAAHPRPSNIWHSREQDPQIAHYQPLPKPDDYVLKTHWSAQHAYNFMRGTPRPTGGYPIQLDDAWQHLHSALTVDVSQSLASAFIRDSQQLLIRFSPGVLYAKPV